MRSDNAVRSKPSKRTAVHKPPGKIISTLADNKGLAAYGRARDNGATHAIAFNIACAVWQTFGSGLDRWAVRDRVKSLLQTPRLTT